VRPEALVDIAVDALRNDLRRVRVGSTDLTRAQLSERLHPHGYILIDLDWHGRRQEAVLAGEMGQVLGRRAFFIAPGGKHPYLCPGYSGMLSVGVDPIVIGDTDELEVMLRQRLPGLGFRDSRGWSRRFVVARSLDNEPALPRGLGWQTTGRVSAAYMDQREIHLARASDGYVGDAVFHGSLTEGLMRRSQHPVAVAAATACIASWQGRRHLRMDWFLGAVAAPILAARSIAGIRPARASARAIILATNRLQQRLRLEILAPRMDRRYADVATFEQVFDEVTARPDVALALASVEDHVTDWYVQEFRRVFPGATPFATASGFLDVTFRHLRTLLHDGADRIALRG